MRNPIKETFSFFNNQAIEEKRNFGLDMMRGIGLLMVLVGHSLHFFEPFYNKIFRLSHLVINGIELFFALSGFLIGRIIIKAFIEKNNYTFSTFFNFLKRRWFKTLPVYYLAIAINLLFAFYFTGYHQDFNWKYLFFIHTFSKSDDWFFPISYSLAMEEWFYLIFPALFLMGTLLFKKYIKPVSILFIVCLLYIVASIFIRTYIFETHHPHWDTVMRKSLITRLDCSIYGVLAAILFYKRNDWFHKYSNLLFISGLLIYVVSMYFRLTDVNGYFYNVIYFTSVPISFSLMIPWFYYLKVSSKLLLSAFTFLSMISFAFYLFHLSPLIDLFLPITVGKSLVVVILIYIGYLAVAFTVATIWYRRVEKPFTDLRDR